MPYMQLEGFTRSLSRLIPKIPSADYSGLRRRVLRIDQSPYEHLKGSNEPIAIANYFRLLFCMAVEFNNSLQ